MKTEDILLFGGLGLAAYLLLKPKTPTYQTVPGATIVPAAHPMGLLPSATGLNVTALASPLSSLVTKLFTPNPVPAATAAANVASQAQTTADANAQLAENTFTQPIFAPVPSYTGGSGSFLQPTPQIDYTAIAPPEPITTDAYLMEFQNGDYPGAQMSGMNQHKAACIGLW